MKPLKHTLLLLSASLAIVVGGVRAQQTSPEAGRWITESGNLEVEIAACGQAYCGTIVRVIANQAMSNPAVATAPATGAASPIGKKIMFDLQPMEGGGWQGHIYNREDNKTYNSRLTALDTNQLKLSIYGDNPEQAKVQVWRRSALPLAQASQ